MMAPAPQANKASRTICMQPVIAGQRFLNQYISRAGHRHPADVVAWMGAVQAQEYAPAKWGLGLRMRDGAVDAVIEKAFEEGRILRTHVMRPTWHFVTPADIRWLLELTAPRVHKRMFPYHRHLGLDALLFRRGTRVIERTLRDGNWMTRPELGDALHRDGLALDSSRLAHLMLYAELEGVICSGPRREKQFTYALVAERAPGALRLSRDEALAELTKRYFRSHGPATVRDFVWWSGLTTADARRGLQIISARREEAADGLAYWSVGQVRATAARDGLVHLLPIYDEYIVAYRDRHAVPHRTARNAVAPREFVTFQHALVIDGQVAGTWRTAQTARAMSVKVYPLRRLTRDEKRELADAVRRYSRFQDRTVEISIGYGL